MAELLPDPRQLPCEQFPVKAVVVLILVRLVHVVFDTHAYSDIANNKLCWILVVVLADDKCKAARNVKLTRYYLMSSATLYHYIKKAVVSQKVSGLLFGPLVWIVISYMFVVCSTRSPYATVICGYATSPAWGKSSNIRT
ncbi:hypothetical protein T11_3538 [Trichinella zimbabwensis]|uniref:Uncharacterized protein n=1 Tax=Trichinella zimbabwensis TaxID=268475 RepID=A0A0V1H315_9BILA|nr:hypothetical protein T11_3538 [Trichinella zimbabwensis]